MEHWIIAAVAPLVELNPMKYAVSPQYRAHASARLGKRARRIFVYQVCMMLLWVIAVTGMLSLRTGR